MSFILTRLNEKGALAEASARQGWYLPLLEFGGACLAIANEATCISVAQSGAHSYALLGSIANHEELRRMLAMFDSAALTASHAALAVHLIDRFGMTGLSFIDGAFVLFRNDPESNTITAVADVLGQYPLYVTAGRDPWIAPNPRLAALKPGFQPDFHDVAEILRDVPRADDYVPIKNIIRVKPGTALQIMHDGQGHAHAASTTFHVLHCKESRAVDVEMGIRALEELLIPAIRNAFEWDGRAYVPLSGGIDSSIVAAFGMRFNMLNTIALGTQRSNEYAPSKLVADHIGSSHSEIEISTDDILSGLFDSIYYNGIFDGYAAEVQASLFALMARLKGKADMIVTGYGADLLLGGTMIPGNLPEIGVNQDLWAQVYRTRWSGEFSPVGANMMGMQIRHPFWTPRFLGYCLNLPESLKVSDKEVKIVLRTFAERQQILPEQTVWRKKIAIHHGSSVEDILSETLGIEMNPRVKELFAYTLYRDAVTGGITPKTFNPEQVLARFRSEV